MTTLCLYTTSAGSSQYPSRRNPVRVPFVTADSSGRPIRDLRREELTLKEDGYSQEIQHLWTEVDLPLTVGLVIDISSSQMGLVRAHRAAVERFINRVVGPSDQPCSRQWTSNRDCWWI